MANKFMITVSTFNLSNDELEAEREVDMNKPETRNWFMNHCIWAWLNNRGIQTKAVNK